MDTKLESLDELENQINLRISEFNTRRYENQKKNKRYSLLLLISSSVTTFSVAVGLKFDYYFWPLLAILANTLAMFFSSLLDKFMYKTRMINCIQTVCHLRELSFDITMHKKLNIDQYNGGITIADVVNYQQRYQSILDTANGTWRSDFMNNNGKQSANIENT